jgi:hypothetical protein
MNRKEFLATVLNRREVDTLQEKTRPKGVGRGSRSTRTATTNSGGRLTLLKPTEKVRLLLALTKLDTVLGVFEDEINSAGTFAIPPGEGDSERPLRPEVRPVSSEP